MSETRQQKIIKRLIESTTLNKEWLIKTNAVPIEIAIYCSKDKLLVTAIYWEGNDGGVWDDENALAIPSTIICKISISPEPEMSSKLSNKLDKQNTPEISNFNHPEVLSTIASTSDHTTGVEVTDEEIKAKANEMYSTLIHMPLRIIWIEASKWMRELTKTK
jgi:hypothetical protein